MKLIQHFLMFLLLLALVLTNIEANPNAEEEEHETNINDSLNSLVNETEEQSSTLHGNGRSLLRKRRLRLTCKKFPRICRSKGSPGPSCCKKKCVNVLTDRLNCGRCGKKCRYNEVCCKGKCVNPSFNKGHCGGCNNRCKDGGFCAFGLCNYA
ncbi:unnamed protein product [Prunus armeniaca]|uniref:Stigma-specific STIG1-like protein 1 n=1 Tax=Prunus armeniaca TaxID=36596 RepID=A0A6J5URV2_PRUAR|nr:unnamed protein product [Prunus armeniaca]